MSEGNGKIEPAPGAAAPPVQIMVTLRAGSDNIEIDYRNVKDDGVPILLMEAAKAATMKLLEKKSKLVMPSGPLPQAIRFPNQRFKA